MKLLNRETKTMTALRPIEDHPDYQSRQVVADRLKGELNSLAKEQTDIINRANEFRRSPVEVLSASYLSHAHPPMNEERTAISARLNELSFRSRAVRLAIERAERDVTEVRYRLSAETAQEQAPQYRAYVRRAISAMLDLHQANTDIANLGETRRMLGYTAAFTPVGLSPWPYWGDLKEESSVWRINLKEFWEQGHISDGEYNRIISGVQRGIEP